MLLRRFQLLSIAVTTVAMCAFDSTCAFAQAVKSAQTTQPIVRAAASPARPVELSVVQLDIPLDAQSDEPSVEPWPDSPPAWELHNLVSVSSTLSGHQVGCQAASCAPLARLLEQRARTLLCDAQAGHSKQLAVGTLQAAFLRQQAIWQRDQASANALRAYYAWIGNRQQLQLVDEGLSFQQQQVQLQEALINRGIAIEDVTALERQRLELVDQRLQLMGADRQLTSALVQLTCCQSDLMNVSIEDLNIQASPLDCERLSQLATEQRADLRALQSLYQSLSKDTVREVSSLTSPLPGAALGTAPLSLLQKLTWACRAEELLVHVRRELQQAIGALRVKIQRDVCDRCAALQNAYEREMVAQEIVRSWQERIAALERAEQLGDARGLQLSTARSQLLTARATLVTRQQAAKLAEVDLAEVVGQLSSRCCRGEPWLLR